MGKFGDKIVRFDPFSKGVNEVDWTLPAEHVIDFRIVFNTNYEVVSKKPKERTSQVDPLSFGNSKKNSNT